MKRPLIIGSVIVIILLIGIGIFLVMSLTGNSSKNTSGGSSNFPINNSTPSQGTNASSTTNTYSVYSTTGETIPTKDFINNGVTAQDTQNPGNYYLAGSLGYCNADGTCPSGAPTDQYHIVYFSQNRSFVIALLKEPLKDNRVQAEDFLMQSLGITQQEMCSLNYEVLTTGDVNPVYAGQNLGFSFCPGAVVLP